MRLSKIAPSVLHNAAMPENREDWYPEYDKWVTANLGPRPSLVHTQARREWDVAAMTALMCFRWFDTSLKESGIAEEKAVKTAAPAVAQEPPAPPVRQVRPPTFAVLDASGNPVIEGYQERE